MGSSKVAKLKRLLEHNISSQPLKLLKISDGTSHREAHASGQKTDPFLLNEKLFQTGPQNHETLSETIGAGGLLESASDYNRSSDCEDQLYASDSFTVELEKVMFLAILRNVLIAQKQQSSMPLPVFLADKEVDLFLLCQNVKETGGYNKVSVEEWGRIATVLGFTACYGPSLKVIYAKYLKPLEKPEFLEYHGSKVVVMLGNIIEKLIVKVGYKNDILRDAIITAETNAHSEPLKAPKPLEGGKIHGAWQVFCPIEPKVLLDKIDEIDALVSRSSVSEESSEVSAPEGKQLDETHECVNYGISNKGFQMVDRAPDNRISNVLVWIRRIAINPGDSSKGQGPRSSRQNRQWVDECFTTALRVRTWLWKKKKRIREDSTRMNKADHISLSKYYDEAHDDDYVVSDRQQLLALHGKNKSSRLSIKSLDEINDCGIPQKRVPIGHDVQAEIPPMQFQTSSNGAPLLGNGNDIDGKKWLGTQVWPCPSGRTIVNALRIGRGRPLSCSCAQPVSSSCHRLHIRAEKEELILELGDAFDIWGFLDMGENVLARWTMQEQEMFQFIVKTSPASAGRNFWDELVVMFPGKSMKDLVSYYFNVYVLRGREMQNRLHSEVIDSEDDEDEIADFLNKTTSSCT